MPFDKKDPGMAMYVKIRGDGAARKGKGMAFKDEFKKSAGPMADDMMGDSEESGKMDMQTIHEKAVTMLTKVIEMLSEAEASNEEDQSEETEDSTYTE